MKLLLHSRTADQFDWSRETIELIRFPNVGDYIKVPAVDGDSDHHEVRMIVHVAQGGDVEAEIFCVKVGPTQIGRLGWKNTLGRDQVPAEEPDNQPSVMMLTVAQAAKAANTSERSIQRLIQSGRLAAVEYGTGKRNKSYRISVEALAAVKPLEKPEAAPQVPHHRRRRRVASSGSAHDLLSKYCASRWE